MDASPPPPYSEQLQKLIKIRPVEIFKKTNFNYDWEHIIIKDPIKSLKLNILE